MFLLSLMYASDASDEYKFFDWVEHCKLATWVIHVIHSRCCQMTFKENDE